MNLQRLLPVTAALALLLSACGSGDSGADGQPLDQPDSTVDADGLRPPTPIRTATGGSAAGGNQSGALASADAATSEMMIAPAYIVTDFVAGDGLGALPSNTTGYVFDAGAMPSADDIAHIADALGVDGEPVLVDDGYSVYYQVGPNDGSAPTITLWDDAMLGWNYSSSWFDEPAIGCAVAGSTGIEPETVDAVESSAGSSASSSGAAEPIEPADPDDEPGELIREPFECDEPEPPTGVPSADEAEATAISYLEAMGVDTSTVDVETWADEWSASVSANERIEGVTARTWSFSFGGDAVLRYAHGSVATPQPVGPYDLIDLDTALERLNDGRYGYGSWGGGIAVMENDIAIGAPAIAEAPPEQGDVEMPADEFPEPEEITVTLTDVGADLWWVWDVDGSAWLLPAYAFTGDDDGTYVVPAVTDDFLVEVEQPVDQPLPEPAPMPVEPDEGPGDGAEPPPAPDMYLPGVDDPTLDGWMGLTLDEFEAAAIDFGWGPVRIAWADGEGYDLTEDYMIGRVNVAVETAGDGTQIVVGARVELDVSDPGVPEPVEGVVAIIEIDDAVQYYPACGNETLGYGGTTWYPLPMWAGDEFGDRVVALIDEIGSVDREPYDFPVRSGLLRVAPPGPGDDTGTLVIWADGFARWVSDNGNLDTWLTTTELQYPWEC